MVSILHPKSNPSPAYIAYQRALAERQRIISDNRSRRMRGLATLPVPPKPEPPLVPVAYEPDGTYAGVMRSPDELPPGFTLKWEIARNPGTYRKPVDEITDRAKRYRANASPPAGRRVCERCGSTRFLVIDHRDGDESNNRQSNKRWLCKSCNTQLGAEAARKGRGVRTRQYNPAGGKLKAWNFVLNGYTKGSVTGHNEQEALAAARQRWTWGINDTAEVFKTGFIKSNPSGIFEGYQIEPVPGGEAPGKIAYHIRGPRGGFFGLMRQREGDPTLMFVLNSRGRVADFKGSAWFTDRTGELKPAQTIGRRRNLPARNLAQYTEAVYYHQRGAHDWGGSVIHETPIRHRRQFAAEIWRRRRGEAPERVKLNPLPLEEAAARYEQFHGRTPREILDAQRSDAVRKTYWALGHLDELEIAGPDCDLEAIDFAGLDPEAKIEGAIPLDFQGDGTELAADPGGHQLYLIGGDQQLDAEDLSYFDADTKKDQVMLGPVVSLTYEARKPPDFQRARYRHFLGEHSGEQPLAFYDRIKGEIALVGGRYHVKDWIYD